MSTCAVACYCKSLRIHAVLICVLLDVEDCAVAVLDELVHCVRSLVSVTICDPTVVDACYNIFSTLDELACETTHDVLSVGRPSAAVDDDDTREVLGSVRNEYVILERLHAWLCINDVLDHAVTIEALCLHDRSTEAHDVAVDCNLKLRCHEFLVGRVEHAAADREVVSAVEYPTLVSNFNLHVENCTCLYNSVSRNSRSNCNLTMCRLVDSHLESVLCHCSCAECETCKNCERFDDAFHDIIN